ncbi:hypothetical protein [Alkalibacillus silvisoli]|uniref:Bifunctional glutamate--cysteine ligase GshA/glutathione synthetase GshB n=1 Tax=Alkalibacillus silvisoli TaxID=392823 RepID=A0ABP3K3Q2_9BACI
MIKNLKKTFSKNKFSIDEKEAYLFVKDANKNDISIKSGLLELVAIKKNLEVKRHTKNLLTVYLKNGKGISFNQMNGPFSSMVGKRLCDRKDIAKDFIEDNAINVTKSKTFSKNEINSAVKFAKSLGYPVVVKPLSLSRGRGITTNISDDKSLIASIEKAFSAYRKDKKTNQILIEEFVNGEDYRFFVIDNKVISVTHRKRANVLGDGKSTILELIKQKNKKRAKNPYLMNYLIPEEEEKLEILQINSHTLNDIPQKNEEVTLRGQSNLSAGGDSIDVTDACHKDYKQIAINALSSIPGMRYGGVDIIANDVTSKPTRNNYVVSEIEFSPAPVSQFPLYGEQRDMAGEILEFYVNNYK